MPIQDLTRSLINNDSRLSLFVTLSVTTRHDLYRLAHIVSVSHSRSLRSRRSTNRTVMIILASVHMLNLVDDVLLYCGLILSIHLQELIEINDALSSAHFLELFLQFWCYSRVLGAFVLFRLFLLTSSVDNLSLILLDGHNELLVDRSEVSVDLLGLSVVLIDLRDIFVAKTAVWLSRLLDSFDQGMDVPVLDIRTLIAPIVSFD